VIVKGSSEKQKNTGTYLKMTSELGWGAYRSERSSIIKKRGESGNLKALDHPGGKNLPGWKEKTRLLTRDKKKEIQAAVRGRGGSETKYGESSKDRERTKGGGEVTRFSVSIHTTELFETKDGGVTRTIGEEWLEDTFKYA